MTKAILRDAMKGIVPDVVLKEKRKIGFNASILDLLDLNDTNIRDYLLDDSKVFDMVKKDSIESMLNNDDVAKSNTKSKFLFNFINTKMFLESQTTN